MTWIATGAVLLVALLHAWFLVTEMFLWQTPATRRVFGTTAEFARASAALAANQGLYNGFLAAGLLWSLAAYGPIDGRPIPSFPGLRCGRGGVRRCHGQQADPVGPGRAGSCCPGLALAALGASEASPA